ncbi:MAG: SIS domain-containing protein [Omnitrophica WOR_2 bacterium]
MTDNHLLNEIYEEPAALRRIYDAYVARQNPALDQAADLLSKSAPVYFAGMATSEYASYAASSLLNCSGRVNFVYDASELMYYSLPALKPEACLVLVSQSGNSAEIVHLLQELGGQVPLVGIYNNEDSALAAGSKIGLPLYAGPQLACGSKTNLSSIALLLLLAEKTLGHNLHEAGKWLLSAADSIERSFDGWEQRLAPAVDFLEGSSYTAFLGRGPSRASAMFTSVLFREVPKVVAEGMGAAVFRHGLREMIRPQHRVVLFAPAGDTHALLIRLAEDLLAANIPVMVITNREVSLEPGVNCCLIRTDPQPEYWAPLVDMVPLQLVGYALAKRRGLEPGKLVVSTYVTTVE